MTTFSVKSISKTADDYRKEKKNKKIRIVKKRSINSSANFKRSIILGVNTH